MSKWSPSNLRGLSGGDVSTLLSKDTEFHGTIKTQGSLRVDGAVVGDVISAKTVTIGVTGAVEGNIAAEDIIVSGHVKGTLLARGRISLESAARLEGDLSATRLSIAEGALFRGMASMAVSAHETDRSTEAKVSDAAEPELDRVATA